MFAPESVDEFNRNGWTNCPGIGGFGPEYAPDTAFRKLTPTDSVLMMIDDLGKAEELGRIGAAVLCYDRAGELMAEKGLRHGGQLFDAYDLY